ncbi:hypothetical protein ES703_41793 [subsurface metagenome]
MLLFWFSTAGEAKMAKSESSGERSRTIKNNIRRLRFENGEMTQQKLADKVGVTRQTIIAIEAGKYAPSLPLAFRIARTFALPIEKVFQYEGEDS